MLRAVTSKLPGLPHRACTQQEQPLTMNDNTDRKVGACLRASAKETHDDLDPALLNEPERDSSDPASVRGSCPII